MTATIIEEGDKRRCLYCNRRVHKDEILGRGCLICVDECDEFSGGGGE